MQQVLAWASTQLEGVFLPDACCCSSVKGPELGGKYGDLVVFSDWDTTEHVPGFAEIPRLDADGTARPSSGPARPHGDGLRQVESYEMEDPMAAREVLQLREQMKNFVQEMVIGRDVCIVLEEENQTETGWLRLTPNLLALRLDVAEVSHEILLRNIRDARAGKMGDGPVKLDDLCSTLMLKGGECVSFRFATMAERNHFTKCVKVLALALEQ
ncbi:unnamed protein product [Durusdinium trenchii]|uniref:Uncharacterized protein n=2 Tax=Durusdinium trenchii TaxID=1381693 RepID=A0ABP0JIS0_9DINO